MARTVRAKNKHSFVGEVEMAKLDGVAANPWNPNKMQPHTMKSLVHGMQTDGWSKSQALLIWRTDETGAVKNIIIDGEQRWTAATTAGFTEGPMVFIDGWTEKVAKAWTIKMNSKRGEFQGDRLIALLADIQSGQDMPEMAMDLGIDQDSLLGMLGASHDTDVPSGAPSAETKPTVSQEQDTKGSGTHAGQQTTAISKVEEQTAGHIRLVQLFFTDATKGEFDGLATKLKARYGSVNLTDIVLEAMRRAETIAH